MAVGQQFLKFPELGCPTFPPGRDLRGREIAQWFDDPLSLPNCHAAAIIRVVYARSLLWAAQGSLSRSRNGPIQKRGAAIFLGKDFTWAEGPAVLPAQGTAQGNRLGRHLPAQRANLSSNGWPVGPTIRCGCPVSPGRCPGLGELSPVGAKGMPPEILPGPVERKNRSHPGPVGAAADAHDEGGSITATGLASSRCESTTPDPVLRRSSFRISVQYSSRAQLAQTS